MKMTATFFGLILTVLTLAGCSSTGCNKSQSYDAMSASATYAPVATTTAPAVAEPVADKVPVYVKK